jgi:hypothetical protein
MSVYSSLLTDYGALVPGTYDDPDVPVGTVVVIRDISVIFLGSPPFNAYWAVVDAAGNVCFFAYVYNAAAAPPATTMHWVGRCVIPAGAHLRTIVGGGTLSGTVSGYVLSNA